MAFIIILFGPGIIWLGLEIVAEGDTEWFGWAFAGLGAVTIVAGLLLMFTRMSLTLDRPTDLVRFGIYTLGKRRDWTIRLSEVDRVELREVRRHRSSHSLIVFIPKTDSDAPELKVSEFLTHTSAENAQIAVRYWLAQP